MAFAWSSPLPPKYVQYIKAAPPGCHLAINALTLPFFCGCIAEVVGKSAESVQPAIYMYPAESTATAVAESKPRPPTMELKDKKRGGVCWACRNPANTGNKSRLIIRSDLTPKKSAEPTNRLIAREPWASRARTAIYRFSDTVE